MGKIGLVCVTNHNYGSILQTFALQTIVNNWGVETEIVRYNESKFSKIRRLRNKEYMRTRFKVIEKKITLTFLYRKYSHLLQERNIAFSKFISTNLKFSDVLFSLSELNRKAYNYDIVLLGSDQVWHPMNLYMNFFTLNFVPDKIIKAAYAPSFGVSKIPKSYKESYRKYINRIQYLSCREAAGVDIIYDLTGKKPPMVCDPTMLLSREDWLQVLPGKTKYPFKYIFCYFIGDNPEQRELVLKLKETTGYKIITLLHIDEYISSDSNYGDYTPFDVDPLDFLELIKNAEYIMTDSFHASVFSILFHKAFFTFNRFENIKEKSTNSRIDSLLGVLDLTERRVSSKDTIEILLNKKEIDFEAVDLKLFPFREASLNYLRTILGRII